LIFALRDQALDRDGRARLENLVLEHAEARDQFVTAMHLQADLHWRYAGAAVAEAAGQPSPESPPVESPSVEQPLAARRSAPHFTWWVVAASLVAAVGGWSAWNLRQPPEGEPHVAARVTKLAGVVWSGAAVDEGAALAVGRRLEPAAGIVELTFASGARVTLSGPARFDVMSAMRGRLETGAAAVKAPPELKGFIVETPSLTVTDLGTEFGVRAAPAGTPEVHVFDGSVEAAAVGEGSHPVLLGERQAIQYWGIELFDDSGEMVEQHRVFELKTAEWNRIVFRQGERTPGGHLAVGRGDRRRVAKVVFRAQTHAGGRTARDLWDDFQLVQPD
jgi:hypothetical protein